MCIRDRYICSVKFKKIHYEKCKKEPECSIVKDCEMWKSKLHMWNLYLRNLQLYFLRKAIRKSQIWNLKAALSGAALIRFIHKFFMKTFFKTLALALLSFVLLLALLSLMDAPAQPTNSHSVPFRKIFWESRKMISLNMNSIQADWILCSINRAIFAARVFASSAFSPSNKSSTVWVKSVIHSLNSFSVKGKLRLNWMCRVIGLPS